MSNEIAECNEDGVQLNPKQGAERRVKAKKEKTKHKTTVRDMKKKVANARSTFSRQNLNPSFFANAQKQQVDEVKGWKFDFDNPNPPGHNSMKQVKRGGVTEYNPEGTGSSGGLTLPEEVLAKSETAQATGTMKDSIDSDFARSETPVSSVGGITD